jgi:PEGA domain-containing protein
MGAGRLAGVLAIALSLVSAPAGADDDAARRAEAKRLRDEGAAALQRGEHELALARFREAYRVFPSPNLLFNTAMTLEKLGREAEALTAFEAFLAEAKDAPPDAREHADLRVPELRARTAHLVITANVDGAEAILDGERVGTTPLVRQVHVMPGTHEIQVRRDGYRDTAERVTISPGETRRLVLTMEVAPVAPPAPEAPPVVERGDRRLRVAGLAVGAIGLACLATGVATGVLAQQAGDELTRLDQMRPRVEFDPVKEDAGKTYQILEGVFLGVGAALVVTAVVLYAVGRRVEHRVSLAPSRLAVRF